jgi:hypothetical protein
MRMQQEVVVRLDRPGPTVVGFEHDGLTGFDFQGRRGFAIQRVDDVVSAKCFETVVRVLLRSAEGCA